MNTLYGQKYLYTHMLVSLKLLRQIWKHTIIQNVFVMCSIKISFHWNYIAKHCSSVTMHKKRSLFWRGWFGRNWDWNTFEMNWNESCAPGLHTQHQYPTAWALIAEWTQIPSQKKKGCYSRKGEQLHMNALSFRMACSVLWCPHAFGHLVLIS